MAIIAIKQPDGQLMIFSSLGSVPVEMIPTQENFISLGVLKMKFEDYRNWLREHDLITSQEFDYLDTLDLGTILCANSDKTCKEIMEIIADKYEEDYLSKYPNDEELFNSIPESEFVDYIYWRYGIPVSEEVIYRFNILEKK